MTTNQDLIEKIQVLPGISDHNLILFDINMGPKTQKKPPRTIYKYDKANKVHIKEKLLKASQDYFDYPPEQRTDGGA